MPSPAPPGLGAAGTPLHLPSWAGVHQARLPWPEVAPTGSDFRFGLDPAGGLGPGWLFSRGSEGQGEAAQVPAGTGLRSPRPSPLPPPHHNKRPTWAKAGAPAQRSETAAPPGWGLEGWTRAPAARRSDARVVPGRGLPDTG